MSKPAEAGGDSLPAVLGDLAAWLELQRELGVETVAVSPAAWDAVPVSGQAAVTLATIADDIRSCRKCQLHESRTKTVPGQGNEQPEILFIGEAPGADEDKAGLAFVGAAGQLLTRMIRAMGLTRAEVFIANILKCRPPGNRKPMPDEQAACLPYLRQQIALLRPRVIIALGGTAAQGLLDTTEGITRIRGRWHEFEGIPLMPTFHPSYLLRNQSAKHQAWADLQAVLKRLGRKPPPRKTER
jgi:DNA polymerase